MIPLRFFTASEFQHPDKLDDTFLRFLDQVRDRAGIPFRLTSDFRTPEENAAATGSSPTSLHLIGRAVDFVLDPWSPEHWWRVVAAVVEAAPPAGVELELVSSEQDHHIHLGLYADGRGHQLKLAIT